MEFADLVKTVSALPCFTARFLAAGQKLALVRQQLVRWVVAGRIVRLTKGLYVLAEPYRKVRPEPFAIAAAIKSPSYVSLESALSWHGLIPEFVATVTSVTTARPQTYQTPLGRFEFRHVARRLFWGYVEVELLQGQRAFVARPEKALLDLVYLTAGGDRKEFLDELRLQNLDKLSIEALESFADRSGSPKLRRAAAVIRGIINESRGHTL
jgi:predicted transcriptional regulator of viral defense system